jgi:hypothetical protein
MSLLQRMAILFGIAFLAGGIMGFIPKFVVNGNLLGLFEVNNMHNIVHIASGIVALLCSVKTQTAKWYFIIFGVVYGLVAVMGFANSGDLIMMHVNMADNILHAGIAVISLWLGTQVRT